MKNFRLPKILVISTCLCLAACVNTPSPSFGGSNKIDASANAEVEKLITPFAKPEIALRPEFGQGDTVIMKVYRFDDLAGDYIVNSNGMIDFPLIGDTTVVGLTVEELQSKLTANYGEAYLQNPNITIKRIEKVEIKVIAGEIVVDGPVNKPGVYEIEKNITLLKAIAIAGGTKILEANTKRVFLIRQSEGERLVAVYNLKDIRENGAFDPPIAPGDAIVVDYAEVSMAIREIISSSPLIALFLR